MENQRPKLELPINSPQLLELTYNSPLEGESKYGKYYCYTLMDSKGMEYSFFAPLKIHNVLKDQVKGVKIKLVKTAVEKNKKLIQDYDVEIISDGRVTNSGNGKDVPVLQSENYFLDAMKKSFAEAAEIQKEYNGSSLSQVAITLFICRTRQNGNLFKEVR